MKKEALSIIIISYNSAEVIAKNLKSLIEDNYFQIIVIDNASPDNSAEIIREKFPEIDLIRLDQNIGYGRAANIGLKMVHTPYALLLNPDLSISSQDVKCLLKCALNDPCGTAWGPRTEQADVSDLMPISVEWISGCAMLFNVSKLMQIGFFDDNIFLFFEETDLCKRIIDSGHTIKLCSNVFFNHHSGKACKPSPQITWLKNWHYGWSRCYYHSKHMPNNQSRRPIRQYRQYRFKSIISLKKKLQYKAQAAGAKAYLIGEKAFLQDGSANR